MPVNGPSRSRASWSRGAGSTTAVALDLKATQRNLDAAEAALAPWRTKDPNDQAARDLAIELILERVPQLFWQGKYRDAIGARAAEGISLEAPVLPTDRDARRETLRKRARLFDALAESIYYTGDMATAEATYREALQAGEGSCGRRSPRTFTPSACTRGALWALGGTLLEMGPTRQVEAEQLLAPALKLADELRCARTGRQGSAEDALGDRRSRSAGAGRCGPPEEGVPLDGRGCAPAQNTLE